MVLFTATSENAFVGGKCALPSALLCEGKLSGTEKCPGEYARGICAGEMSGSRTLYAYCAADKVDVIISLAHSDKTNCRVCSTLHCSTGPRIRPLNARHTSGANLLTVWAESGQIAGPAIVPGAAAAAATAAAAYLMQSRAVHASRTRTQRLFFSCGDDGRSIFSSCAKFTVGDETVLSHYG